MDIEKRFNRIWNGEAWVEVYHPTSADLVDVGGGKKLDEKLTEIEAAQSTHASDTTIHTTAADKAKLANLPTDTNQAIADINTTLGEHAPKLITTEERAKLSKLAEDAEATYATKAEVSGQKQVYYYASIEERDADDVSDDPDGTLCWVAAPAAAGAEQKATNYMLEGGVWKFLFEADANMVISWADIDDAPLTLTAFEEVIAKCHEHANMAILNAFSTNEDDELTWNGAEIGRGNVTFFQTEEPTKRIPGDTWLGPIV